MGFKEVPVLWGILGLGGAHVGQEIGCTSFPFFSENVVAKSLYFEGGKWMQRNLELLNLFLCTLALIRTRSETELIMCGFDGLF